MLLIYACVQIFPVTNVAAQDTVVTRKSDGTTVPRRGAIADWSGLSLLLEKNGRTREIDNEDIIRIETRWPAEFEDGKQAMERGRFAEAIRQLLKAVSVERRPWAQNIILSKLIIAQHLAGNHARAAESFFKIVRSDPNGRFLHQAVIPWETDRMLGESPSADQARAWLDEAQRDRQLGDQPAVRLVAAAWMQNSANANDQRAARALLEELAVDLDPTIAALATGQLWRQRIQTQRSTMTEKQIDVWRKRLALMPEAARAGPLYVIAAAERKSSMTQEAIRDYMRIAILYSEQSIIAAPALYRAADLLHNDGQSEVASGLMSELKAKYPYSPWVR